MLETDLKKRVLTSLTVSIFLSFTLFFFAPLQVFLTNTLEFDFQFPGLVFFLLLLALAGTLIAWLLLAIFSPFSSLQRRSQVFIFTVGLLLWLQSTFLVWRYGPLDGRKIDWQAKAALGLVDGAVWLALLVLAQLKLKFIMRILKKTAWALMLLQLLTLAYYYFTTPPFPNYNNYSFDKSERFTFSDRRNVIILLVDNFQSDVFAEVLREDNSLKDIFPGFTYFRNNLGGFPVTYASVPLILTGKHYDNSRPIQSFMEWAYHEPSSLPATLTRNGVTVDLFPATPKIVYADPGLAANIVRRPYTFMLADLGLLLDITLFRALPQHLKRLVYNQQKWWLQRLLPQDPFNVASLFPWPIASERNKPMAGKKDSLQPRKKTSKNSWRFNARRFLPKASRQLPDVSFVHSAVLSSTIQSTADVFKFYHWMGVHDPFNMNENLEPEVLPATRSGWKRIVRGELKLIQLFFKVLQRQGIYERSLIFVIGDHGHPRGLYGRKLPPDLNERKSIGSIPPHGVIESGTPLMLVKRFAEQGELKVSDAPVSTADIARTIFSEMGVDTDCPGESVFTVAETAARPRFYYFYTWTLNDWQSQYLPPLVEYRVDGHCWLAQNWHATGRVLRRP